jgi:Domain of unknown function (DUF4352)
MGSKAKKPFYKKWWVWLIAIIVIGAATQGEDTPTDSAKPASTEVKAEDKPAEKKEEPKKEEPKKEEKKSAGLNTPVKVGDVTFTAAATSTSDNVGGEYGQDAQGTYLIVDVAVKNEGKKAITTDTSFFKLKVGDTEYEADSTASVFANQNAEFFLQSVNPGIENKGKVVFDVPADVANSKELMLNVQTGFFGTEQGQINISK